MMDLPRVSATPATPGAAKQAAAHANEPHRTNTITAQTKARTTTTPGDPTTVMALFSRKNAEDLRGTYP